MKKLKEIRGFIGVTGRVRVSTEKIDGAVFFIPEAEAVFRAKGIDGVTVNVKAGDQRVLMWVPITDEIKELLPDLEDWLNQFGDEEAVLEGGVSIW